MESKDLIIIVCAIIAGACIIALITVFVGDMHDDTKDMVSTNCTAENVVNDTTASTTNEDSQSESQSDSGVYIVSEVVKYNYQADDGSYYREVTYSDGGSRQYNTSSGNLIGSSYSSDQKYLPTMY
ncbi:flagellar protein, FliL [uncultured Methanobrevibacter sp.]|uniref:flagellar protein, FliL n=1 Tax=uncultured Methanobrevibacter sp. TaxID=253161 RepID=UPI00261F74F1|nr:flagellar protein, FliL [uncultured Methanobrevibacter sp.]